MRASLPAMTCLCCTRGVVRTGHYLITPTEERVVYTGEKPCDECGGTGVSRRLADPVATK
jgi:hypothetical protein